MKTRVTKNINPNFFYAHELQEMNEIKVLHTKSSDDLGDQFTRSLPATTFEKCVWGIGI